MENYDFLKKISISLFCIDKRFDYLTTEYFDSMDLRYNYYSITSAGSVLSLSYEKYCKGICNCRCKCDKNTDKKLKCNPNNPEMELLKLSILKNIEIASSLDDIKDIYLLNHQDCGAIKAFLSCSNYPNNLGENNPLEIEINTQLLLFAKNIIEEKYKNITNVRLGLIDINGSVADYDAKYCSWNLVYRGIGNDPKGLWYGL